MRDISSGSIVPLPSTSYILKTSAVQSSQLSIPKSPIQFLLWGAGRGHIYSKEEFLEINEAIVVAIKCPEDVGTKLLCIS